MQPATARVYAAYQDAAERARTIYDLYMDARASAAWAPFRRYTESNAVVEHLQREWHEAVRIKDEAYREWRRALTAEIGTTVLPMPAAPRQRFVFPRSRVS